VIVSRSKNTTGRKNGLKDRNREQLMKVLLISFAVGLFVGILYGVIRVKSPAPPIVALLGLLGMVLGEQLGGWILTKNASVIQAASVCLVGKHWGKRADVRSVVSVQPHRD
jgi:XapX domain-containing protein